MDLHNECSLDKSGPWHQKFSKVSLSDPDLTTANGKYSNSGFPPGFTVDELSHYRKKRQPGYLISHDNLKSAQGAFKLIKSEYKDKYKKFHFGDDSCVEGHLEDRDKAVSVERGKKPEDHFKLKGSHQLNPEYYEMCTEYPGQKEPSKSKKVRRDIDDHGDDSDAEELVTSENQSRFVQDAQTERPQLLRRKTNLNIEGELMTTTEKAEKFIEYLFAKRPDLARQPTTLRLEGEMDIKTENRDKFTPFEYQRRPPLCKKYTNLHLEGDLEILTESSSQYVAYEIPKRPPLVKRHTNLHLEGDLELLPEYREVFVEHKLESTETGSKFFRHQVHPTIPFLREFDKKIVLGTDHSVKRAEYKEKFVKHTQTDLPVATRPKENLKHEGDMQTATENQAQYVEKRGSKAEIKKSENNLALEGKIDLNPEYKNAYVNFYDGSKKAETFPLSRRRAFVQAKSSLRSEGEMDTNPEYRSSYVDFPRQRPSLRRPEAQLYSEGDLTHVTEKRAQYIEYPNMPKTESIKRQPELKLEGRFECQPEYRKAYIDYLIRERVERKPRPLDNLSVKARRVFEITDENGNDKSPQKSSQNESHLTVAPNPHLLKSRSPSPRPPKGTEATLAKIENSVFGPKLNPSSRRRRPESKETKSSSASRRASPASGRQSPAKRFDGPVKVPNLAYHEPVSPLPPAVRSSIVKQRWMKDEEKVSPSRAFVVLDDEFNNNSVQCNRNKSIYKEHKWMPSWYSPSN